MNEDDKDRHGQTMSDVILQNITLDCFLPVYVRPLPGIAFPSFVSPTSPSPAVKRAANAGSGKGVCQRRRRCACGGGGGGLLCEAASPPPVVRPSVARRPPLPKTHSLLCSLCGDNDDAVADKIRLLAYALHAGLFRIQKEGRDEMKRNSSRW